MGYWLAEFEDQIAVRQLELHPRKAPVLLTNLDSDICEFLLDETSLKTKPELEVPLSHALYVTVPTSAPSQFHLDTYVMSIVTVVQSTTWYQYSYLRCVTNQQHVISIVTDVRCVTNQQHVISIVTVVRCVTNAILPYHQ